MFEFIKSDAFGFLLKLFAGLAAAAFGILGIGAKTRDETGKLTRSGWIALAGILMAGGLAVSTNVYEFVSEQQKARAERRKSERLMLSVQRGIFPFRGITVTFTLMISADSDLSRAYSQHIQEIINGGLNCQYSQDCYIDIHGLYHIPSTSRLFPRDSRLRALINNCGVRFQLLKEKTPPDRRGLHEYTKLGAFRFTLGEKAPRNWSMIFKRTEPNFFTLRVDDYELPDSLPISSDVYSLVELMPGAIAARPTLAHTPLFGEFVRLGSSEKDAIIGLGQGLQAISIGQIQLRFNYPKSIDIGTESSLRCSAAQKRFVATLLPDDVDSQNDFGQSASSRLPGLPDSDVFNRWNSFLKPDTSPPDPDRLCEMLYAGDTGDN